MTHSLRCHTDTQGPTKLGLLRSLCLPVSLLSWPAAFRAQADGHCSGLSVLQRGTFRERQQQSNQDTEPLIAEYSLSSNPFYPPQRPSAKAPASQERGVWLLWGCLALLQMRVTEQLSTEHASANTEPSMHGPCLLMLLPSLWPDLLVCDFLHPSPIAYFTSGSFELTLQADILI